MTIKEKWDYFAERQVGLAHEAKYSLTLKASSMRTGIELSEFWERTYRKSVEILRNNGICNIRSQQDLEEFLKKIS